VQVKARLGADPAGQPPGDRVETLPSDEGDPSILSFEVTAPAPIINAHLSVSARGLAQRRALTVRDRSSVEFKLPPNFAEPKISYALTDEVGRVLARGEVKLEDLRQEDYATLSEVTLDRPSYAPGESGHLVVTVEGRSPHGYRLEVTAKDAAGAALLRDSRRGVYHEGKSIQEFRVEIPAEAKGRVFLEVKVFGNLTGKLFDSGERVIAITPAGSEARPETEVRPIP
jgi:hypothetical protein